MAPQKLPRIASPLEIVGAVSAEAARASGLLAGTPVAAGLGDTAASFLACGAVAPGICVDVAGTASVFAATVPAFAPDLAAGVLGCGRSAVPGLWHPYAYINGGGLNLNWFAEQLAGGGGALAGTLADTVSRLDAEIAGLEPTARRPVLPPAHGGARHAQHPAHARRLVRHHPGARAGAASTAACWRAWPWSTRSTATRCSGCSPGWP